MGWATDFQPVLGPDGPEFRARPLRGGEQVKLKIKSGMFLCKLRSRPKMELFLNSNFESKLDTKLDKNWHCSVGFLFVEYLFGAAGQIVSRTKRTRSYIKHVNNPERRSPAAKRLLRQKVFSWHPHGLTVGLTA